MASNTANLNLYKANPVTDKDNTFNIDTILNDNWDKIDANVAKKTEIPAIPSSLPANGGNSTTVNQHTAAATPNTNEKVDLVGMVNEVKTDNTKQLNDLKTSVITSDFTGKIAGSTTENPNICKATGVNKGKASLLLPSDSSWSEISGYNLIKILDNNCYVMQDSTNGGIPQQLFSFDLISIVERKYGTIPGTTADKVAWLKNNISKIICNWYGYGSCPSGNKACLTDWSNFYNKWGVQQDASYAKVNTSNSPSLLSFESSGSTLANSLIGADGFIYLLAYTDASNGTTTSTINTDYINIQIEFKDSMACLLLQANKTENLAVYQVAGGTETAITLATNFINGYSTTFIASANNNGSATTINGKALYRPNTTNAPNLIANKAYTVWYNATSDCFFIKASAEGNVTADKVLAGYTFSNDYDIGLVGTATIENLGGKNSFSGSGSRSAADQSSLATTINFPTLNFTPSILVVVADVYVANGGLVYYASQLITKCKLSPQYQANYVDPNVFVSIFNNGNVSGGSSSQIATETFPPTSITILSSQFANGGNCFINYKWTFVE